MYWTRARYLLATVLSLSLLLFHPRLAHANVGIPVVAYSMGSMVLALFPVVLLEACLIWRALDRKWWDVLWPVVAANGASTMLGVPLAWLLWWCLGQQLGHPGMSSLSQNIATQDFYVFGSGPHEDYPWMIPLSMLCGLVPAYFASVVVEGWLLRHMLPETDPKRVWRIVWRANLASYFLMALVPGITLGIALRVR